jgi:hypothetical protein
MIVLVVLGLSPDPIRNSRGERSGTLDHFLRFFVFNSASARSVLSLDF